MSDKISVKETWKASTLLNKNQYVDMYNDSTQNSDNFWKDQAKRINWITPFSDGCIKKINFSKENLEIKWFYDGELNVSYNCIDRHLEKKHPVITRNLQIGDHCFENGLNLLQLHDKWNC